MSKMEIKECVIIDGVRTANARAHAEKGWFKDVSPHDTLAAVYTAIFERNPKVKPEDIDAVMIGTANPSGLQNDIGRIAWLASGLPASVPSQTISNQCPSGMSAFLDAARSIMVGEADFVIAGGAEDMEKVAMGSSMAFPNSLWEKYDPFQIPMGNTAEKVAGIYDISREDMENMTIHSHKKAFKATQEGKFKNEIIPVMGTKEDGTKFLVEKDQWIRETLEPEKMAAMKTPFQADGRVTAATSSPLTAGAAGLLLASREKADELGLSYSYKYKFGTQVGNDPTVMGMGPELAIKKIFEKTGLTAADIGTYEINEAFAAQAFACIRETGIDKENAPFDKVNTWGGALALGHPLGESGARIIVTLINVMKQDFPDAKYGIATLCGGFGNGVGVLIEKV
jgi:acetyl-CoA acyltransferase